MLQKYLKWYAAAVMFLLVLNALLFGLKPAESQLHKDFVSCTIFFGLMSPFVYWMGSQGLKSTKHADFLKFYYGSFMLKLFVSLFFVIIYLLLSTIRSWHFIIAFGTGYFLFTAIETLCLMKVSTTIKHENAKNKKDELAK